MNAPWIWLREAVGRPAVALLARKEFDLATAPSRASLAISANHAYRAWINGELVGRGPDRADPRFPYFDTWEVARLLRPGKNVLLAIIQHARTDAFQEQRFWCLYDGPGGFLAQLEADGRVVTTDATWRMAPAPGWEYEERASLGFRSPAPVVDLGLARRVEAAAQPGFDDSRWSRASVLEPDQRGLLPSPIPREIPPLVRATRTPVRVGAFRANPAAIGFSDARFLSGFCAEHPPVVEPSAESVWLVYDFGRTMGGFPSVEIEAGAGELDLHCGESLQWLREDRLRLPASGTVRYESLDWRGCRYLALHFHHLTGPATVRSVRFIEMDYPFEERGDFRCSDETLTRIWRVCRTTARVNTKDHPVDCCGREQALWISDLQIHGRAIAACFGDLRPVEKALRQAFRVMDDSGVVPVPGPVGLGYRRDGKELEWSEQPLTLALTLRDLYWQTGDASLPGFAVPRLERLYAHFARYEDSRGLLDVQAKGLPSLVTFCGWNPKAEEGIPAILNFEYVQSLAAASELARATGRDDLAGAWFVRAEQVRAAGREAFWDASRRLFLDGEKAGKRLESVSSTTNAMAVLAGALDPAEAGAWAEAMRTNPRVLRPVSPLDAALLLDAFVSLGLDLHARALLDDYYGSIVRAGEPTLPEFWSAGVGAPGAWGDGSRCHAYGAAPADVLIACALGCRAIEPGWRRARIEPRALGLAWARGRRPTPLGEIGVAWERDDLAWRLEVELPSDVHAEVVLPRLGWGSQRLTVNGEERAFVQGWKEFSARYHLVAEPVSPPSLRVELAGKGRFHIVTASV